MIQNPPSASIIEDLEDLYENAPCGYVSLDPRGRIFKVNKTLCNWVGYAPEQMLGKRLGDLSDLTDGCLTQRILPHFCECRDFSTRSHWIWSAGMVNSCR